MPTYTIPPTSDPPLVKSPTVTFSYSIVSITLQAPNFGNTERMNFSRVIRESRAGTLEIFYDPQWPTEDILVLPWEALTQTEYDDLLSFLNFSLGQTVTYVDHEGLTWEGIITNPNAQFKTVSKGNDCSTDYYSVSLEFLGTITSWP